MQYYIKHDELSDGPYCVVDIIQFEECGIITEDTMILGGDVDAEPKLLIEQLLRVSLIREMKRQKTSKSDVAVTSLQIPFWNSFYST